MPYRPLWESLASEARGGKGLILAIDAALRALWDALNVDWSTWGDPKTVELASGELIYDSDYHHYIINTEGSVSADSMVKITGVPEHVRIILRGFASDRVVTVTDGPYLKLRGNFLLNDIYDSIVLIGAGSGICYEESRCSSTSDRTEPTGDEDMRLGAAYELTIAGGICVGSSDYQNLIIDTEGDIASDTLNSLLGYVAGDIVVLSPASGARTVVVANGGNFTLQGVNFIMDDVYDSIMLMNLGSDLWKELSRSGN